LLDSDLYLMTTPSSSPSKSPSLSAGLPLLTDGSTSPCKLNVAEHSSPRKPYSLTMATFSEALILGVGGQCSASNKSPPPAEVPDHPPVNDSSEHQPPSHPASMRTLCLLGKPWGETIPLPVIISNTRKDWGFVKGQIDYLDLGNGWILFRFSNLQDITLVGNGRTWHVSGLNLVLRRWEPFFDPFSATIQRIDQWVKITCLPLELWEEETLKQLLQNVGQFIRVDDITLSRSKGKFARVCINIDITKPLRRSLFIPVLNQPRPLEVPISYEGLHEVCAMCGSDAHELEVCPETPKGPIEVIVEKFGAMKIHNDSDRGHKSASLSSPPTEK